MARPQHLLRRVVRSIVDQRGVIACLASAATGWYGLAHYPFPANDPVVVLLAASHPSFATAVAMAYRLLWFTTPFWAAHMVCSVAFIFCLRDQPPRHQPLPPYPAVRARTALSVVLGELHHRVEAGPSPTPRWLIVPARGCQAGILVIGATGSGKTAGALRPIAEQLFGFAAADPARKVSGLVLEVKGDFTAQLKEILVRYGREADYREVTLAGRWRYNPLHQPHLDAYALAYTVASLIGQLWGRSKEPFWEMASTNLLHFLILLHRIRDEYVTLLDLYSCAISPTLLEARIKEVGRLPALQPGVVTVPLAAHPVAREATQARARWEPSPDGTLMRTEATPWVLSALTKAQVGFALDTPSVHERLRVQWEAVRLWYEQEWSNLDPKLRTSIVEGVASFLGIFSADADLQYTLCPPKDAYRAGTDVLPPFAQLIEEGRVCAVNFPVAANPAVARMVCTLCKMDAQRALLLRIPLMSAHPDRLYRYFVLLGDEYPAFATAGATHPGGDEQFLALSRQALCIPVFAIQGISSLITTLPAETWRPLLAQLRTKIFLSQTDDLTARWASDMCGRIDRLRRTSTFSETGRDASVSLLSGRAVAKEASLGTTTAYSWQREPLFEPREFTELANMESIVLAYDGTSPIPAQRLYLKPYFLPPDRTHFDYVNAGAL